NLAAVDVFVIFDPDSDEDVIGTPIISRQLADDLEAVGDTVEIELWQQHGEVIYAYEPIELPFKVGKEWLNPDLLVIPLGYLEDEFALGYRRKPDGELDALILQPRPESAGKFKILDWRTGEPI